MRERLYWTVLGGLCFWLPSFVSLVLDRHASPQNALLILVILPLAGFASLCAVSWIASRHEPKWGWVLAGIYILGSILNFALSVHSFFYFLNVPGAITWRLLLYFLPPGDSWMAVLIATPALAAMCLRPKRTAH